MRARLVLHAANRSRWIGLVHRDIEHLFDLSMVKVHFSVLDQILLWVSGLMIGKLLLLPGVEIERVLRTDWNIASPMHAVKLKAKARACYYPKNLYTQ